MEINNNDNNKENKNATIKKIDLDKTSDKENIIKTIKNIINSNINSSQRSIKIIENEEKNKEDENKNNNNNNDNISDKEIEQNEFNKEILNKNFKNNNIIKENIINNNNDKIEEEKYEDDLLLSCKNSNIKISDIDVNNSSKLILEEINCNLFNGKKIEINAAGMVGGRNKKDGISIFGQKIIRDTQKSNDDIEEDSQLKEVIPFIPDFELNFSQFLSYPYIFTIYFKKEEKVYYIKAYSGKGSDNKILFIKLNNKNKFILNQKELILTGNTIFQLTPKEHNCIEIINLSKNNHNNKYIVDGFNKKVITIGRNKDCDFSFPKDKSFSRYQTTFEFNEETKKWSIIDGYKDKGSTNGTWIFGVHSFLIKDEMIVEILNRKIKIKEIKDPNSNI